MSEEQWWYNTETGEVSQEKTQSWSNRMGPYGSADEARRALEIARQRAEAADSYDEED